MLIITDLGEAPIQAP